MDWIVARFASDTGGGNALYLVQGMVALLGSLWLNAVYQSHVDWLRATIPDLSQQELKRRKYARTLRSFVWAFAFLSLTGWMEAFLAPPAGADQTLKTLCNLVILTASAMNSAFFLKGACELESAPTWLRWMSARDADVQRFRFQTPWFLAGLCIAWAFARSWTGDGLKMEGGVWPYPEWDMAPDTLYSCAAGCAVIAALWATYRAYRFDAFWMYLFSVLQAGFLVVQLVGLWELNDAADKGWLVLRHAASTVTLFSWVAAISAACISWTHYQVRTADGNLREMAVMIEDRMASDAVRPEMREALEEVLQEINATIEMTSGPAHYAGAAVFADSRRQGWLETLWPRSSTRQHVVLSGRDWIDSALSRPDTAQEMYKDLSSLPVEEGVVAFRKDGAWLVEASLPRLLDKVNRHCGPARSRFQIAPLRPAK